MMTLLQECVEALESSGQIEVCENRIGKCLIEETERKVAFARWGRINWECYTNFKAVDSQLLESLSGDFFIFWREAGLPVICADIKNIACNIDDVLAVDFDTWLVACDFSCIIEFFHDGQKRILYI